MKSIKIICSLILLFSMQSLVAQYGQGGYGQGGMGGNPNMQNQQRSQPKEPAIEETVKKVMDRYNEQLKLDELQVIAVSNIITECIKKQNAILKKEDGSNEEKANELKAITEKMDLDILILLNKDQKTKYKLMSEDSKKQQEAYSRRNR
ncbi:MAG: hypothetical protein QE264_00140 [Flavobacterium sp.]|nr:hypothetical protein [Flavobacterium sp.]